MAGPSAPPFKGQHPRGTARGLSLGKDPLEAQVDPPGVQDPGSRFSDLKCEIHNVFFTIGRRNTDKYRYKAGPMVKNTL